jgi:hypothetical protein
MLRREFLQWASSLPVIGSGIPVLLGRKFRSVPMATFIEMDSGTWPNKVGDSLEVEDVRTQEFEYMEWIPTRVEQGKRTVVRWDGKKARKTVTWIRLKGRKCEVNGRAVKLWVRQEEIR